MPDKQFFNVSGRLVQGDVFDPQTTNMQGHPLVDLKGNPKVQYFMGVAVAKNAPDFAPAWAAIGAVAARDWPTGESQRADFSWKVIDGDAPQHAGKEGFPGHWIFRFTSGYPWQAVTKGAASPIVDPSQIKRGYYVKVFFSVAGNKNATKPGVYLNGSVVELIGYGTEISSGPDAAALVAAAGVGHVPAGMQATPVGGAPVAAPVVAPVAAPVVAPVVAAPVVAPVIAPNPAILNPTVAAPSPVVAAPAAAPVVQAAAPGTVYGPQP